MVKTVEDLVFEKSFITEGFEIVNPFLSECGRFEVDNIKEYYGLSDEEAKYYEHEKQRQMIKGDD